MSNQIPSKLIDDLIAALDWEEHTSAVYAERVSRVARQLPRARVSSG